MATLRPLRCSNRWLVLSMASLLDGGRSQRVAIGGLMPRKKPPRTAEGRQPTNLALRIPAARKGEGAALREIISRSTCQEQTVPFLRVVVQLQHQGQCMDDLDSPTG